MNDNWTDHFTDNDQTLLRSGLRMLAELLESTGDIATATTVKDLLRKLDGQPAIG